MHRVAGGEIKCLVDKQVGVAKGITAQRECRADQDQQVNQAIAKEGQPGFLCLEGSSAMSFAMPRRQSKVRKGGDIAAIFA